MDKTFQRVKYPDVGTRVKCVVTKASFAQATLRIVDVEGVETAVHYKAVLKGNSVGEEIYVCDKVKTGDIIECVVLSHGDNAIFVSPLSNCC